MDHRDAAAGRICVTLDVDWARDEIVQTVLEMLQEAGVKATFFATHRSELLMGLEDERYEVGLHPNFNQSRGDFVGPTEALKALYPRAAGGRSHSLATSYPILMGYMASGLVYESNLFLPMHEHLRPASRVEGMVSIPLYWYDDTYFSRNSSFGLEDLRLDTPGLKVLGFHPIHVFMNTSSAAHYASYKEHYQNPAELQKHVNRRSPGAGTMFRSLLDHLSGGRVPNYTLFEIYQEYTAGDGGRANQ